MCSYMHSIFYTLHSFIIHIILSVIHIYTITCAMPPFGFMFINSDFDFGDGAENTTPRPLPTCACAYTRTGWFTRLAIRKWNCNWFLDEWMNQYVGVSIHSYLFSVRSGFSWEYSECISLRSRVLSNDT